MFSIIIPLYNKAAYIEYAINSIFAQSFHDFELIVVDDGSTDDGVVKLQVFSYKLQEERPSQFEKLKIIKQQNQGVSVARNNGVKAAKYDYIAFLDADDWWAPNYLQEMAALIPQYPDAGLYASSYYKVKGGQNIPALIGVDAMFSSGYFDYFEAYAKSLWMPVWTGAAIVKKQLYEQVGGFNANLTLGEDFDLWVRIALHHKTVLINKALAYYNQDVDMTQRGVVNNKIYKPEEFFLFNLAYLEAYENKNIYIKAMLDRLRVYTLKRYRIQNVYAEYYKREIAKVDFSKQAYKMYLFYKILPPFLLRMCKGVVNKVF